MPGASSGAVEEVNTAGDGAHVNWPERFFAQIVDGYLASTGNRGGRVGNAISHLISARDLYNFAEPVMVAAARSQAP